jgi:hypothetical protein
MPGASAVDCRILGYRKPVPPVIASYMLCTDHFSERATSRVNTAWESCHTGVALEDETLDALLREAQSATRTLISTDYRLEVDQHERILEFLLCVANLHEFAVQDPGYSPPVI